jgi:hypothetical protein
LARVRVEDDAAIAVEAARVDVELDDGARLGTYVEHASGSLARPLSDAALEAKVRSLAQWRRWPGSVEALIEALSGLAQAQDAAPVVRLLGA